MNATELREMNVEQLQATLNETTESLFRLRTQAQTERLDAPSELRRHRRLIATIKTIQRERDLNKKLIVKARFVDRATGAPISGGDYRVKLFDKDIFVDDPMGDDGLDAEGRMLIECDVDDAKINDGLMKFFEGNPDLYVILEKESKEVFRSRTFRGIHRKRNRRVFHMGTFKV